MHKDACFEESEVDIPIFRETNTGDTAIELSLLTNIKPCYFVTDKNFGLNHG